MIKLRLAGGLGNQLFQVGAMLLLAKTTNLPIYVYESALDKYKTKRTLEVTKILDLKNVRVQFEHGLPLVLRLRLARLVQMRLLNRQMVSDNNFQKVYHSEFKPSHIYAEGYFIESINQEVFDDMLCELSNCLKPFLTENRTANTCVIHVRGGDFLDLGLELPYIKKYYSDSIDRVLECEPSINFEIISDDLKYARQLLSGFKIKLNFSRNDIETDFHSLVNAKFAILSNSTFAFWAGAFRTSNSEEPSTWMPRHWRPGQPRGLKLRTESW